MTVMHWNDVKMAFYLVFNNCKKTVEMSQLTTLEGHWFGLCLVPKMAEMSSNLRANRPLICSPLGTKRRLKKILWFAVKRWQIGTVSEAAAAYARIEFREEDNRRILEIVLVFIIPKSLSTCSPRTCTVWKFHNFAITQILREISFWDSKMAKSAL